MKKRMAAGRDGVFSGKTMLLSLAYLLCILLAACSAGQEAQTPQSSAPAEQQNDEELVHAVEYGFVPEYFSENWESAITEKEMADLSTAAIALCDPDAAERWADTVGSASQERSIQRDYGALFLFLSAREMGCGTFLEWDYYHARNAYDSKWDMELTGEYPLFQDFCREELETQGLSEIREVYIEPMDYVSYSMLFTSGKVSLYSNKALYDEEQLAAREPLTRAEAVLAFSRLLDNSKDLYITLEDAALEEHEIGAEALTAAAELPDVHGEQLPDWRGTSIAKDILIYTDGRELYTQEDAELIRECGFNYVRIVCNHTDFTKEIDGTLYVHKLQLRNIDRIIGWCLENGIHVCLDLHSVPGYVSSGTPDILEDPTHYAQALAIWDMLSRRYADVPANGLSYNLLNEPGLSYFTQESYGAFAMDMIQTIRNNDAEKLIVSDGLLSVGEIWSEGCPSVPCTQLPADIVQSIHLYPSWNQGVSWLTLQNWPQEHLDAIGDRLHRDSPWTISGDFKAGSEVTLYYYSISGINRGVKLFWETDGAEHGEWSLDGITVGENNCTDVTTDDWGTQYGAFDRAAFCISLTEDADHITLKLSDNDVGAFVAFDSMYVRRKTETEQTYPVPTTDSCFGWRYESGTYTGCYIEFVEGAWTERAVNISIADDGTYRCDNCAEGTEMFDLETLRAYIELWADWKRETGGKVICNEFAVSVALPEETRTAYMDDLLTLLEENGIPWSLYTANNGEYGPIHKNYTESFYAPPNTEGFVFRDNYAMDLPLLTVLQRHIP